MDTIFMTAAASTSSSFSFMDWWGSSNANDTATTTTTAASSFLHNATADSFNTSSSSFTFSSYFPDDSLTLAIFIWSALEVAFYLIINRIIHPRLDTLRDAPENPLPPRECLSRMVECLERLEGIYTPDRFWSGWFKGANYEDIKRDNIKAFLAWAAWHLHPHELSSEDQLVLEDTVVALEVVQGKPFPEGFNETVEHVAFTRESLSFSHRFLGFYVIIKAFQLIGAFFLKAMGHTHHITANGLTYWHRPCQQTGPLKQAPLLFFHGISPGLWFYIPFLAKLGGGREVILLEVPHIVTQLVFEAPDMHEIKDSLGEIFQRHHVTECAVAGHSFGSIVAGWAASHYPNQVQQLILIDPVCLLLCLPDVAVNFLYRRPSSNLMERSIKDFIDPSSEITVAHALRRHFWWYQNVLWLQDVRCHIIIALSSEDDIVPSEAIYAYVRRHYGIETPKEPVSFNSAQHINVNRSRSSSFRKKTSSGSNQTSSHVRMGSGKAFGGLPDARVLYWKGLGHGAMLASKAAQNELIQAMASQAKEQGLLKWEGSAARKSLSSPCFNTATPY